MQTIDQNFIAYDSYILPGFQNGEILVKLSSSVQGHFKARLVFDHEEVPEALSMYDIGVSKCAHSCSIYLFGL